MNKKGEESTWIPSEFVKFVLAIGCVVLLFILGVYLFGIFQGQTQIEQAKSTLEQIIIKSGLIKEGQQEEYLYVGPEKWFMQMRIKGEVKECGFDYCLCLCNKVGCNEFNVCKETISAFRVEDQSGAILHSVELDAPLTFILQNKSNGFYVVRKTK